MAKTKKMSKFTQAKALVTRAKTLYPSSKFMRHQWVRKTEALLQSGSHILQTGQFRSGRA
jgi:hypothetical protein